VEYRILGPLQITEQDLPVALTSERQRAIVELLALRPDREVEADRIVEGIWGEAPPPTALHALHVHLSALRARLGAAAIETRPRGYRLRVEPEAVDRSRFELLVKRGVDALGKREAPEAAEAFDAALGLWRGEPVPDLATTPLGALEIARLGDLRSIAVEGRLDAHLWLGDHAQLIPELRTLVAEEPLREGLRVRLMLALYRSGRQAESLDVYHDARRILHVELGVDPGPELEAMQTAVLGHDPALLAYPTRRPADEHMGRAQVSGTAGRTTRRSVIALVADISPADDQPRDPEALAGAFELASGVVREAIRTSGGTLERALPLVAMFGIPIVHEDDALRAAAAAIQIRSEVDPLVAQHVTGVRMTVRAAIAEAEVVVRVDEDRSQPDTAAGIVVASAERLLRATSSGEILLGSSVARLLRSTAVMEPTAPDSASSGGPPGARLVSVIAGSADRMARPAAPFVGRERELGSLHEALEKVIADRTCHLISLLGEAGIGKSRLVHEFLGRMSGRVAVARGRCLPYGERVALWPLAEAVRQAVGCSGEHNHAEVCARLVERMAAEPRGSLIADRVAAAIGVGDAPSGSTTERLWAVRRFVESIAADRPLLLVFDDVQWADPGFLDVVDYIAETSRESPIMLLCIARQDLLDERPGWGGGKLNAMSILVGPLADAEIELIAASALAGLGVEPSVVRNVVAAADGNPLFAEEWVAMIADDGQPVDGVGSQQERAAITALAAPPSIMAVLAARLDRLPPVDRDVLERASVVGKTFTFASVQALASSTIEPGRIDSALASLIRRELIRPDPSAPLSTDAYRFKHILIRDAAYASIPKSSRAALHEAFADWLETSTRDRSGLDDELIGSHLEQAYRCLVEIESSPEQRFRLARASATHLGAAGRRSLVGGDTGVAVRLLQRAADLTSAPDPDRLELLFQLGLARSSRGELAAAEALFDELDQLAVRARLDGFHWRAVLGRVLLDDVKAQSRPNDRERVRTALRYFESTGDTAGSMLALQRLAGLEMIDGRLAQASRISRQVVGIARRSGALPSEATARAEIGACELLGETPVVDALVTAERNLLWARRHELIASEAVATSLIGRLKAMQGDIDEGRRLVSAAIAIVRDLGRDLLVSSSGLWLEFVEQMAGDADAVERILRASYAHAQLLGARSQAATYALDLCRILLERDAVEEAGQFALAAEQIVPNWVPWWLAWSKSCSAAVMARQGRIDAALQLSDEALAAIESTDNVFLRADALVSHSEILQVAGQRSAAVPFRERAIQHWERKGVSIMAHRIRDGGGIVRPRVAAVTA
jgi:DNA-binding SARP family transcriptional activator/tetratricopeptide (TPR) repeat protein